MSGRSRAWASWAGSPAFVYCAGAALRLARFNTNIGVVDKRFFQGLPSPAAAALVTG
jgi:CDP-diacylglycerol--serine O-phosphatidyltransferase